MGEFTPVATTRIAVTNVSNSVSITNLAAFQVADKSGNAPVDSVTRRRPFVLRMTYISTAGAANVYWRKGAGAQTADATKDSVIIAAWPVQAVLREFEDTIAAVALSGPDTGTLVIDIGYGDAI